MIDGEGDVIDTIGGCRVNLETGPIVCLQVNIRPNLLVTAQKDIVVPIDGEITVSQYRIFGIEHDIDTIFQHIGTYSHINTFFSVRIKELSLQTCTLRQDIAMQLGVELVRIVSGVVSDIPIDHHTRGVLRKHQIDTIEQELPSRNGVGTDQSGKSH